MENIRQTCPPLHVRINQHKSNFYIFNFMVYNITIKILGIQKNLNEKLLYEPIYKVWPINKVPDHRSVTALYICEKEPYCIVNVMYL